MGCYFAVVATSVCMRALWAVLVVAVSANACVGEDVITTVLLSSPEEQARTAREPGITAHDVSSLATAWLQQPDTRRSRAVAPSLVFRVVADHVNATYAVRGAYQNSPGGGNYDVVVGTAVLVEGANADGGGEDIAVLVVDPQTSAVYSSVRRGAFVQSGVAVNGVLHNVSSPVNTALFPDEGVATSVHGEARQRSGVAARRCAAVGGDDSGKNVSVIVVCVLYTPEVVALTSTGTTGEVEMLVAAAVAEANAVVYPRSGVQMEIRVGAVEPTTSVPLFATPYSVLDALATSPAVAAVRDANACDVVVQIATLDELHRSVCGIGFMFPGAHAVVALECFKDNYSFLHELHHTSGACHGDPSGMCAGAANGYGSREHSFRTIEAYSSACGADKTRSCTRIPRVSNELPAYTWDGAPIGDARHSNARILNANREAAAARRC